LNRYVYALKNPVRLVDFSGFSAKEGMARNNCGTSDQLHEAIVDKVKLGKLKALMAQYEYTAALEEEAAYWRLGFMH